MLTGAADGDPTEIPAKPREKWREKEDRRRPPFPDWSEVILFSTDRFDVNASEKYPLVDTGKSPDNLSGDLSMLTWKEDMPKSFATGLMRRNSRPGIFRSTI